MKNQELRGKAARQAESLSVGAYLESAREDVLGRHGWSREAYRQFIQRHLGTSYAEGLFAAAERGGSEEAVRIPEDGYGRLFSYQDHLDSENRLATASYYTPQPVASYLTSRGFYCLYEDDFRRRGVLDPAGTGFLKAFGEILVERAGNLPRVADLSAGTGLFLLEALRLVEKALEAASTTRKTQVEMVNGFVSEGLFANDLQVEGLELYLLALLDHMAPPEGPGAFRTGVSFCDAVSDQVAGTEFDLILGNPPYLGEKGNRPAFAKAKASRFGKRYYEARMDFFYYFIHKALELLKPGGVLSYVTTAYFTTADGGEKLRTHLRTAGAFREIFDLGGIRVFDSAKGQHNLLFVFKKGPAVHGKTVVKKPGSRVKSLEDALDQARTRLAEPQGLFDRYGNIVLFGADRHVRLSEVMLRHARWTLGDLCGIRQGLVSGCDRTTRRNLAGTGETLSEGLPIFVFLSPEEVPSALVTTGFLKPFYKNSDIGAFRLDETDRRILYLTDHNLETAGRESREAVLRHLSPYRKILERRREVRKNIRKWYALQWYREEALFTGPKLMVPHRAKENFFAYSETPCYASADVYFIRKKEAGAEPFLKALCCVLNSDPVYFWLKNHGKKKGGQLELYHTPLKRIPLPDLDGETIGRLAELHDRPLDRRAANEIVCGLYGLSGEDRLFLKRYRRDGIS